MKWRVADFFVIGAVVLAAAFIWLYPALSTTGKFAEIREGDRVQKVSLASDSVIELEGATVTVEGGTIAITESDCPDRVCINTGKISKEGQSIICVPGEIVITVSGASQVDAVSN